MVRKRIVHIWKWVIERKVALAVLFALVVLPLWAFGELAEEVVEGEPFEFDVPVLLFMQSIATPWLDEAMVVISLIGYRYGVVPLDILVALFLAFKRRWGDLKFWAYAVGGAAVLNLAAKHTFGRDRPSLWDSIAPEHTFSFPSGHAMGSMALAAAIWVLLRPTKFGHLAIILGSLFVLLVGFSRIYLGVHYPSDILAGWAASLGWVIGVSEILYSRWGKPTENAEAKTSGPVTHEVAAPK
jgi:membrane-associated phospholipid phosphatase